MNMMLVHKLEDKYSGSIRNAPTKDPDVLKLNSYLELQNNQIIDTVDGRLEYAIKLAAEAANKAKFKRKVTVDDIKLRAIDLWEQELKDGSRS